MLCIKKVSNFYSSEIIQPYEANKEKNFDNIQKVNVTLLTKDQLFDLCKDHQNTLKAFTRKESKINSEMNIQEQKSYKKSTFVNSDQQYKIKLIQENKSNMVELKNVNFSCSSSSSSFSLDDSSTLDNNINERSMKSLENKENCDMSTNIKKVFNINMCVVLLSSILYILVFSFLLFTLKYFKNKLYKFD